MYIIHYTLFLTIFLIVKGNDLDFLSKKNRENLGKLPLEEVSDNIRRVIRDSTLNGTDTEHRCCNINPVKTIYQSRSQLIYVTQERDKVVYSSCGFLWLKRCSHHSRYYTARAAYRITYTSRTIPTTCPAKNLVCCQNYVLVSEHCIAVDQIQSIKTDQIDLYSSGALG